MFSIRPSQFAEIEAAQLDRFAHELVDHLGAFAPVHARRIGHEALLRLSHDGIRQARRNGLTLRGPVRLFLELQVMLGSSFATDPQYPWVRSCLEASDANDEMARAMRLHEQACHYHAAVLGDGLEHEQAAIRRLRRSVFEKLPHHPADFAGEARSRLMEAYPEKARFIGAAAIDALVAASARTCTHAALDSPDARALVLGMMFAFGHACLVDCQHAWIRHCLADTSGLPEQARVQRLRGQFLTFLRQGDASEAD